jgi:ABC-type multidrug transport system fused ATPase/permease subunit
MHLAIVRNIAGYRLRFAFIIFLSIIQSGLDALSITALLPVGGAMVGSNISSLQWPLSELGKLTDLGLPTLFFWLAIILFLKVAIAILASICTNSFKRKIWQQWAHDLLRWQLYMPYKDWVYQDSGELINLSTRELSQASSFLAGYVAMLTQVFSFVIMAVAVLIADTRLMAIASVVGTIAYFVVLRPLSRVSQQNGEQSVSYARAFAAIMSETIGGARDIRLMSGERQRLKEIDESVDRLTWNDFVGSLQQDIPNNGVELILALLLAGLGVYFSVYGQADDIMAQAPVILFFLVSVFRLTSYAAQLSALHVKTVKRFPSFMTVVVAAKKAARLPAQVELGDRGKRNSAWQAKRCFELKSVTFAHGDRPVLTDVNLRLPIGTVTYLRGPSGSGKSSIADILARLHEPAPGTVFIDGQDATTVPIVTWRALIGYASQDPVLFSGTLLENMRMGFPDVSPEQIHAALSAAGADEAYFGSGWGLEFVLAERGRNLSGGQKCRIAIARALLSSPSLLILDESTGGIDLAMEANIVAQLKSIKTISVLVISHRKPLEGVADQEVALDNGRLRVESLLPKPQ